MRLIASLLALGALALASAHDFPTEDKVLVLGDDNFEDAIAEFDTLLVEFYAPWCGHCKNLAPEYAKAAEQLEEDGLYVAKVDATENKDLGEKYDVSGFPTLKFFRNGNPTEYNGGRTEDAIVNWIRKKSGPAAKSLDSKSAVDSFVQGKDAVVVGFFEDAASAGAKAFMSSAGANDELSFGMVSDAAVRSEFSVAGDGDAVVLFKSFDDGEPVAFDGKLDDASAVGDWVTTQSLPVVVAFSQKMAGRIFAGPVKVHFLLFVDAEDESAEGLISEFTASAKDNRQRALHITVSPEEDRVMSYFDITEGDLPAAVLVDMPDGGAMKKFMLKEELTTENFAAHITAFESGELKPFLKSDPVPTDGDDFEGNVKVVVGNTFIDVALDQDKDVLVEFYAPWCGHCKSLAPEYEKAADRFAEVGSVVLAKIDATANEVDYEGVNVGGFPTLYFFPAGRAKNAMLFDGARNAEGLEDYILKNANSDFELPPMDDDEEDQDEL